MGRRCYILLRRRTTETSWWPTTEKSRGVSFESCLRRRGDVLMGLRYCVLLRRRHDVLICNLVETYHWDVLATFIEMSLGVSFGTYLQRRWDVQRDVLTMSSQRLVAGWVYLCIIYFTYAISKWSTIFNYYIFSIAWVCCCSCVWDCYCCTYKYICITIVT